MVDQWLTGGGVPSADIFTDADNTVNLKDFAVLAEDWLDCSWIPTQTCP